MINSHVGSYRVVSLLGVGGMGEVYRAQDTRLNREVALKVLPPAVSADVERLARFKREAQVLASLNHPHIGAIYGLEESGGVQALVLELVEGPTLAGLIATAKIPLDEVLSIARQIAEALEAAHEKGIVHRDLKPANVKITPDRGVKVLDFGLAKAVDVDPMKGNAAQSPTLSLMATQAGIILGTAAYMSPEQARGLPADHRSDIFSFGVVLYEMLTGRTPFAGDTVPDILASVLARDPDLSALPPNLNPRFPELIRRCLDKHPKQRWQAIGDVRAELDTIASQPVRAQPAPPVRPLPNRWLIAAALGGAALVGAAVAGFATWRMKPADAPAVVRLALPMGGQRFLTTGRLGLAISPDGQRIAFVSDRQLYLRKLSESVATAIRGTDNPVATVNNPVFSPDGQWLAFFGAGEIKKVPVTGGTATPLCTATNVARMFWDAGGIVFSDSAAVRRVSPNGGQPELLFQMKREIVTDAQLLPGGRTLLLAVAVDNARNKSRIVTQPLPSGEPKVLVEDGGDPNYLPDGRLIFARGGVLFAAFLDPRRLTLSEPVSVLEGVRRGGSNQGIGAAQYAVSSTGTLAYLPGPATFSPLQRNLTVIDLSGAREPLPIPLLAYRYPRVSRDGRWVAVDVDDGNDASVYVYRLSGATQVRRLTTQGHNRFPIWSADSARVIFQSELQSDTSLFWQPVDGTQEAERLTTAEPGTSHVPEASSPDGKTLLFSSLRDGLYTLHAYDTVDRRVTPLSDIRSMYPLYAAFSPDGLWLAYYQRDPGSTGGSLFVRRFPNGMRNEVVKGGGIHPVWLSGPKQQLSLLYRLPTATSTVSVTTSPDFVIGAPTELPWGFLYNPGPGFPRSIDPIPNSDRFVTVGLGETASQELQGQDTTIQVVVNWFQEMDGRVPGR